MGQVILITNWACTGPYLSEPGVGLQLDGAMAMEWQAPEIKTYAHIHSKRIKAGGAGSLEIWLGSVDRGFGEYGRFWAGTEMMQLDWERLVTDNF